MCDDLIKENIYESTYHPCKTLTNKYYYILNGVVMLWLYMLLAFSAFRQRVVLFI